MQPKKPSLRDSPYASRGEEDPVGYEYTRKSGLWPPIVVEDRRVPWISAALSIIASVLTIIAALATLWALHIL